MLDDNRDQTPSKQWAALGAAYRDLIEDAGHSSSLLREQGLKPTVLRLLGDCTSDRLLDAGTGGGWLFDEVRAREAHACDLVEPANVREGVAFTRQDVGALDAYADGAFDAIVSSLVLCYREDVDAALREFHRVAADGGRLVVALVHPYFYRTGVVTADGSYTVEADLSERGTFAIEIGHAVGPFKYHFKGVPDYLNAMIGAGWTIDRVEDWFMDADRYAAARAATDGVARSHKVPVFTFMRCRKASGAVTALR